MHCFVWFFSDALGDYRGIQVNKGFVKGEWTLQITAAVAVIKDPSNKVFAKGTIGSYKGELWLITGEGRFRGMSRRKFAIVVF